MLENLISILVRIIIAGWIFHDSYNKKRYNKWPSIAWTVGALIFSILVWLFYLLFRPPQDWVLKKGVGKINPEFMEKKYRLLDNILMVIAIIAWGVIVFLFGNVIPTFTQMSQEVGISLSVVCKISLILGHWVWAIGFLLLVGIALFFKHPRLVRFHRRHAPRSYVDYILIVILGSGFIVGLIVISMYLPIFEMSTMIV
jgi:hypothetical protein